MKVGPAWIGPIPEPESLVGLDHPRGQVRYLGDESGDGDVVRHYEYGSRNILVVS